MNHGGTEKYDSKVPPQRLAGRRDKVKKKEK